MDWSILYQATFFISLAFMAVVISVFAFVMPHLGEESEKVQEQLRVKKRQEEEEFEKQIDKLKADVDNAGKAKSYQALEQLEKQLDELLETKKIFEKQAKRVLNRYQPLTVSGGVVYPIRLFFISLISSAIAWSFTVGPQWAAASLEALALIAMTAGYQRLYTTLKRIEEVATTSKDTLVHRSTEAIVGALKKLDEEKKPRLELEFIGNNPPFHVKRASEFLIEFCIRIKSGEIARQSIVFFLAPTEFSIVGKQTRHHKLHDLYEGYLIAEFKFGDLLAGVVSASSLTLRAPSEGSFPREFNLVYSISCEGFRSGNRDIKIVVDE